MQFCGLEEDVRFKSAQLVLFLAQACERSRILIHKLTVEVLKDYFSISCHLLSKNSQQIKLDPIVVLYFWMKKSVSRMHRFDGKRGFEVQSIDVTHRSRARGATFYPRRND